LNDENNKELQKLKSKVQELGALLVRESKAYQDLKKMMENQLEMSETRTNQRISQETEVKQLEIERLERANTLLSSEKQQLQAFVNDLKLTKDNLTKEKESALNSLNMAFKQLQQEQKNLELYKTNTEAKFHKELEDSSQRENKLMTEFQSKEILLERILEEKKKIENELKQMKQKYEPTIDSDDEDLPVAKSWVSNDKVSQCPICMNGFSYLNRKHHCRRCGRIFCGNCTKKRVVLPDVNAATPSRVCDVCFDLLSKINSKQV